MSRIIGPKIDGIINRQVYHFFRPDEKLGMGIGGNMGRTSELMSEARLSEPITWSPHIALKKSVSLKISQGSTGSFHKPKHNMVRITKPFALVSGSSR